MDTTHPAPEWIIYEEKRGKQILLDCENERQEPSLERHYLKGVTWISEDWIVSLGSQTLKKSQLILEPEPFYSLEKDAIVGRMSHTYGPFSWNLPMSLETVSRKDSFFYFAKALLHGKVNGIFKDFVTQFSPHPKSVQSCLLPKMSGMVHELARQNVFNLDSFKNQIK